MLLLREMHLENEVLLDDTKVIAGLGDHALLGVHEGQQLGHERQEDLEHQNCASSIMLNWHIKIRRSLWD